jgi:cytochrome c6
MPIRPIARRLLSLALWLSLSLPLLWPQPSWAASPEAAGSRGAQLFGQHCAGCHVNGGNIIRRSKTLKLAALQKAGLTTPQAIAAVATNGIGQMSGYAQVLGKGGPEAVGNYVWQQAQAGWPRK